MDYLSGINMGFKKNIKDGIIYYTVPSFEKYVDFAFCGDKSNDLAFKAVRGRTAAKMKSSFNKLCTVLSMPYEACVMTNIVHDDTIVVVDNIHRGLGVSSSTKLPPCDGLITMQNRIPIASTHADCMPIAFYDKKKNIGCVVHAGWRGILAGIQKRAVEIFIKDFDTCPKDLLVAIGPAIQKCCFEVDKDITDLFKKEYLRDDFIHRSGIKDKLDLLKITVTSLLDFGIPAKNITVDNRCTACKESGLESYRRDKDCAGTMVQIMCLR